MAIVMTDDNRSDDAAHMWVLASRYSAVGIEMAAAVALGAVVGNWVDQRYELSPWGMMAGFGVGLGAAVKAVARIIRMQRRDAGGA